jgi:hypothetical protein
MIAILAIFDYANKVDTIQSVYLLVIGVSCINSTFEQKNSKNFANPFLMFFYLNSTKNLHRINFIFVLKYCCNTLYFVIYFSPKSSPLSKCILNRNLNLSIFSSTKFVENS